MDGLHLVTVLATDGDGPGPVVTVRSLRDRTLTCRRALNTTASDGKEAGVAANRVKVYASPGYAGSGVFVVAAGGGEGECAIIWRAAFDEGNFLFSSFLRLLNVGLPSVCAERNGRGASLNIVPVAIANSWKHKIAMD